VDFVDIHTHKKPDSGISIINIFPEDAAKIENKKKYSAGIHPQEVSHADITQYLKITEELALLKNVVAIGETGLDKRYPEFELQKEVFLSQIKIAEKHKKPVIVHCVRAYSDLSEILKKHKPKVPFIIHRYSGNKTIAGELLKFGCFLSFGHELFNEKSKPVNVIKAIPPEKLFLETDDYNINIEDIYKKAAELIKINKNDLKNILYNNYVAVFRNAQKLS